MTGKPPKRSSSNGDDAPAIRRFLAARRKQKGQTDTRRESRTTSTNDVEDEPLDANTTDHDVEPWTAAEHQQQPPAPRRVSSAPSPQSASNKHSHSHAYQDDHSGTQMPPPKKRRSPRLEKKIFLVEDLVVAPPVADGCPLRASVPSCLAFELKPTTEPSSPLTQTQNPYHASAVVEDVVPPQQEERTANERLQEQEQQQQQPTTEDNGSESKSTAERTKHGKAAAAVSKVAGFDGITRPSVPNNTTSATESAGNDLNYSDGQQEELRFLRQIVQEQRAELERIQQGQKVERDQAKASITRRALQQQKDMITIDQGNRKIEQLNAQVQIMTSENCELVSQLQYEQQDKEIWKQACQDLQLKLNAVSAIVAGDRSTAVHIFGRSPSQSFRALTDDTNPPPNLPRLALPFEGTDGKTPIDAVQRDDQQTEEPLQLPLTETGHGLITAPTAHDDGSSADQHSTNRSSAPSPQLPRNLDDALLKSVSTVLMRAEPSIQRSNQENYKRISSPEVSATISKTQDINSDSTAAAAAAEMVSSETAGGATTLGNSRLFPGLLAPSSDEMETASMDVEMEKTRDGMGTISAKASEDPPAESAVLRATVAASQNEANSTTQTAGVTTGKRGGNAPTTSHNSYAIPKNCSKQAANVNHRNSTKPAAEGDIRISIDVPALVPPSDATGQVEKNLERKTIDRVEEGNHKVQEIKFHGSTSVAGEVDHQTETQVTGRGVTPLMNPELEKKCSPGSHLQNAESRATTESQREDDAASTTIQYDYDETNNTLETQNSEDEDESDQDESVSSASAAEDDPRRSRALHVTNAAARNLPTGSTHDDVLKSTLPFSRPRAVVESLRRSGADRKNAGRVDADEEDSLESFDESHANANTNLVAGTGTKNESSNDRRNSDSLSTKKYPSKGEQQDKPLTSPASANSNQIKQRKSSLKNIDPLWDDDVVAPTGSKLKQATLEHFKQPSKSTEKSPSGWMTKRNPAPSQTTNQIQLTGFLSGKQPSEHQRANNPSMSMSSTSKSNPTTNRKSVYYSDTKSEAAKQCQSCPDRAISNPTLSSSLKRTGSAGNAKLRDAAVRNWGNHAGGCRTATQRREENEITSAEANKRRVALGSVDNNLSHDTPPRDFRTSNVAATSTAENGGLGTANDSNDCRSTVPVPNAVSKTDGLVGSCNYSTVKSIEKPREVNTNRPAGRWANKNDSPTDHNQSSRATSSETRASETQWDGHTNNVQTSNGGCGEVHAAAANNSQGSETQWNVPAATKEENHNTTATTPRNAVNTQGSETQWENPAQLKDEPQSSAKENVIASGNTTNETKHVSTSKTAARQPLQNKGWISTKTTRSFVMDLQGPQISKKLQHNVSLATAMPKGAGTKRSYDDLEGDSDDDFGNNKKPTGPNFAYKEVVRCKKTRQGMPCHDCFQCKAFYQAIEQQGIDTNCPEFQRDVMMENSRHRSWAKEPETPPGFWELSFADSIQARAEANRRNEDHDTYMNDHGEGAEDSQFSASVGDDAVDQESKQAAQPQHDKGAVGENVEQDTSYSQAETQI